MERKKKFKVPSEYLFQWSSMINLLNLDKYQTPFLNGEESLETIKIKEHGYDKSQGFRWETLGIYHDVTRPAVEVEFESGFNGKNYSAPSQNSSLSDDEAINLFHEVVDGIRPRPVNGKVPERW